MAKKGYDQVYDGIPFQQSTRRGMLMQCCSCAFVHLVRIRIKGKSKVELVFWRDKKATKAERRRKRKKLP